MLTITTPLLPYFHTCIAAGCMPQALLAQTEKYYPHSLLDKEVTSKGDAALFYHGPLTAGK
jgi:hypothetical protein